MASYQDILKQIDTLKSKAEEQRRKELQKIVDAINEQIAEFGLRPNDLKFPGHRRGGRRSGSGKAKYRNPTTGKTWTGRGRAPHWITEAEAAGTSRDRFLIK
ncbi:MAG: H-NS histone family protein [Gammaproteobacteria bacterium]|nr:H-NS histone family protein [Gammaproteobacteria bacterium]